MVICLASSGFFLSFNNGFSLFHLLPMSDLSFLLLSIQDILLFILNLLLLFLLRKIFLLFDLYQHLSFLKLLYVLPLLGQFFLLLHQLFPLQKPFDMFHHDIFWEVGQTKHAITSEGNFVDIVLMLSPQFEKLLVVGLAPSTVFAAKKLISFINAINLSLNALNLPNELLAAGSSIKVVLIFRWEVVLLVRFNTLKR